MERRNNSNAIILVDDQTPLVNQGWDNLIQQAENMGEIKPSHRTSSVWSLKEPIGMLHQIMKNNSCENGINKVNILGYDNKSLSFKTPEIRDKNGNFYYYGKITKINDLSKYQKLCQKPEIVKEKVEDKSETSSMEKSETMPLESEETKNTYRTKRFSKKNDSGTFELYKDFVIYSRFLNK